jgi:hypothetical protein
MLDSVRAWWCVLIVAWCVGGTASEAAAGQLGALVSPGPLAKAHAALEGVRNCVTCHEAGRKVTVGRCLSCHKPIAERIARRVGVHRAAGTDCVTCHVDHAGRDGELRRMDVRTFNHAAETGVALDGKHAPLARDCAACHKQRTFLDARPACASCHSDVHKGTLGTTCTACHSTTVAFKDADSVFDHARSRFPLTGAHQPLKCVECHATAGQYRGLAFDKCSACHDSPHRTALAPNCTTCHVTASWTTRTVAHDRTRFPLVGSHAKVTCEGCHTSGDMAKPVRFDQCSLCHSNVHRESIKEDCRACHTETSFHVTGPTGAAAKFDHAARTGYALEGKHSAVTCQQCHKNVSDASVPLARKVVDYSGAKTECLSCHTDTHKGEYGVTCQACHRTDTFDVKGFTHPRAPEFYGGEHATLTCVQCHVPEGRIRPTRVGAVLLSSSPTPSMTCATCHSDIHLGQFAAACDSCHDVKGKRFAAVGFSHVNTKFPLTGRHEGLDCVACHKTETRSFPSGSGTATRFAPTALACESCHTDPHLGQMKGGCDTCHAATTFKLPSYTHQGMSDFFGGFHGRLTCESCHKRERGAFPGGPGTAVRYLVGRTCAACHEGF